MKDKIFSFSERFRKQLDISLFSKAHWKSCGTGERLSTRSGIISISEILIKSYTHAISVETMAWSCEYRVVVAEEFIRNRDSPITTQRTFGVCFFFGRLDPFLNNRTIHNRVSYFREIRFNSEQTFPWSTSNSNRIWKCCFLMVVIEQYPRCSAKKHSSALRLSDRSNREILHHDLKLQHHKTAGIGLKKSLENFINNNSTAEH